MPFRPYLFLITFLALVASAACPAFDSQLTAITAIRGELRVGVLSNSVPFSYEPPGGGDLTGHQVDLAKQFAKDMGVPLQLVTGNLEELIRQLENRNVDIIMAATPLNVETAKHAAFTQPWGFTGVLAVMARNRAGNVREFAEFRGKGLRVGYRREPPVAAFLSRLLPNVSPIPIDSTPSAVTALTEGAIDVYFTNNVEASVMSRGDQRVAAIAVAQPAVRRSLAWLVRIDDPIWRHYVNTWLNIKRETGYVDSVAARWGLLGQ